MLEPEQLAVTKLPPARQLRAREAGVYRVEHDQIIGVEELHVINEEFSTWRDTGRMDAFAEYFVQRWRHYRDAEGLKWARAAFWVSRWFPDNPGYKGTAMEAKAETWSAPFVVSGPKAAEADSVYASVGHGFNIVGGSAGRAPTYDGSIDDASQDRTFWVLHAKLMFFTFKPGEREPAVRDVLDRPLGRPRRRRR